MTLRPLLSGILLAALAAAPAAARPGSVGSAIDTMRDPAAQHAAAGAMQALSEAILDMPLAPLERAIAAARGDDQGAIDPDLRLRDYAGPDAERVPEEMAHRVPEMMGAMGEMAGALEQALPALAVIGVQMRERFDQALEPVIEP